MALFVITTDNPKAPSELEDDETSTLFWNQINGFGSLSDATVYTEEEANTLDLPIAYDQPIWTQLPDNLILRP